MYSSRGAENREASGLCPPDMRWVSTAKESGERRSKLGCTGQQV